MSYRMRFRMWPLLFTGLEYLHGRAIESSKWLYLPLAQLAKLLVKVSQFKLKSAISEQKNNDLPIRWIHQVTGWSSSQQTYCWCWFVRFVLFCSWCCLYIWWRLYLTCWLMSSRFTKPQTFADCVGDELPFGWEQAYYPDVGVFYTNHIQRKRLPALFFWRMSLVQPW